MRAMLLAGLLLTACEGRVGDFGETAPMPIATIRDRSGPELTSFTCSASSVTTRERFTCTLSAKHPTNQALHCAINDVELADCSTPQTASFTFASPGPVTLQFTARDPQDRLASRVLTVQVTGLANQPPSVTSVSATSMSGTAPLRTTLRWQAVDPEGDAITCAIDIGADGTLEHPAAPCSEQSLLLKTVGAVPVRVIATDSGGLSTEERVTLTVAPPTVDLRIESVEYGQTVLKPDLALVGGKPALLRVTVLANEPGVATTVRIIAKQGSTTLGTETLTGPALTPTTAPQPGDLINTWRLQLPEAWMLPGVSFELAVDPTDDTFEADEQNNARTLTPTISRDHLLHLTAVPVTTADGQTGDPMDISDLVTRLWPVKGVEMKTRAPYTSQTTLDGTVGSWSSVLGDVAQAKGLDGSARAYYGFVKSGGFGIAGIGYVGQHAAIGRDDSSLVAAHELGHNFGLQHAPCGPVSGADASYPYPNGSIGTWGVYGMQLVSPANATDVMGYCQGSFVSDFHYEKVQRHAEGREAFDPTAVLAYAPLEDALFVRGTIKGGRAVIGPAFRVRAAVTTPSDSPHRLTIVGISGARRDVPVEIFEPAEGDESMFFAVVPWTEPVASLRFMGTSRTGLSELVEDRPTATLTRLDAKHVRVTWPPSLQATVAHLATERTTLTIDARGGSLVLRTDGLEGGTYEVSLSSGLSTNRVVLAAP